MDEESRLIEWAAMTRIRDDLVWAAFTGGVSKQRIFEITGLARSTVNRIIHIRQSTMDCQHCGYPMVTHDYGYHCQ